MTTEKTGRGLRKPGLSIPEPRPPRCAAMAVGSVPHTDPQAAVDLILAHTPDIPAWPQLPRRSFLENMYVQFAEGFPGLVVDTEARRVYVRNQIPPDEVVAFLEAYEGGDPGAFAVSEQHAAALPVLRRALENLSPPFVKGQITGPISFGLTVPREDRRALLYDDTLRDLAARLLARKARWQADLFSRWAPASVPLIMVDEPSLTQLGSAFLTIPVDIAFPALEECLAAIPCLAGIHVCGGTDWESLARLPVDVLNFDAADYLDSVVTQREAVAAFVAAGGLLAWGCVPNDERAQDWGPERAARQVLTGAEALAATGAVSVDQVLRNAFVSPACGTGSLPLSTAERCFTLAAETSAWLRRRL